MNIIWTAFGGHRGLFPIQLRACFVISSASHDECVIDQKHDGLVSGSEFLTEHHGELFDFRRRSRSSLFPLPRRSFPFLACIRNRALAARPLCRRSKCLPDYADPPNLRRRYGIGGGFGHCDMSRLASCRRYLIGG